MKRVYTQTFSQERVKVDNTMDSYFNDLVYNQNDINTQKFHSFLQLFDLKENEKTKTLFEQINEKISIMQHEMQHEE